jgi:hypothetical protein
MIYIIQRTFVLICVTCVLCVKGETTQWLLPTEVITEPTIPISDVREHPGGTITRNRIIFEKKQSPYLLRNDLIIERDAELVIEPGVEVRFAPQVGVTVRGILTAVVSLLYLPFLSI